MISSAASPPVVAPTTVEEALELRATRPELTVVAGGTDVMVGVNEGRAAPAGWLSLHAVAELRRLDREPDGSTTIGAGVTMAAIVAELASRHPALAQAARTVGGPQIRAAATIGGNVMTSSPAGDTLPVLLAADATLELRSVRGARAVRLADFQLGPKHNVAAPDELLVAVRLPARFEHEHFAKVGPRNAMVIAVCSLVALSDGPTRGGAAIGSSGPTVLAIPGAAGLLANAAARDAFAAAVAATAVPIDDVRGSAAYRRHALTVLARRVHGWIHRVGGTAT